MKLRFLQSLFALGLVAQAQAATFSIPDSGISFNAPDGFTELSKAQISAKYPPARPPAFAVGNTDMTTTIAYDWKQTPLPADKLAEVKTAMESVFERTVPGLKWEQRKLVTLQDRQWIQLEFLSSAQDTDIHNVLLITSHHGRMLIFNFNSTIGEFKRLEPALRDSMTTISLQ